MCPPEPETVLSALLRATETRLKAFDTLITEGVTCGPDLERILSAWRELVPDLYLTLGAAYGGARTPLQRTTCDHGVALTLPCKRCRKVAWREAGR